MGGAYSLTEHEQGLPPGVSQATASTPLPDHKGEGVHTVPMHPGSEKGLKGEHTPTKLETNLEHASGGKQEMIQRNYGGKHASVIDLVRAKLAAEKEGGAVTDFLKKRVQDVKDIPKNVGEMSAGRAAAKRVVTDIKAHEGALPSAIRKGMESDLAGHKQRVTEGLKGLGRGAATAAVPAAALVAGGLALRGKKDEGKTVQASSLVEYMAQQVKAAEDAINPAKITAGPAVPPETSASGEAGGTPVGGAPQGPTGLVGSNEAARDFDRRAAYANRKEDLKKYFVEPAMSAEHDKVLQVAFENTGKAGPKIASAQAPAASVKTAAARVLLSQLAGSIDEEQQTRTGV
jgi:hypothetical protein